MEARYSKSASIRGMLHDYDIQVLLDWGAKAQADIVEIGTFQGKSAVALAEVAPAGLSVICVDPFHDYDVNTPKGHHFKYDGGVNYNAFKANIARCGVADRIHHIRLPSVEAAKVYTEDIGLLFVDARHEYEHVQADFEAWQPHLIDGAIVIFHDYSEEEGVTRYVDELRQRDNIESIENRRLCAVLRFKKPTVTTAKKKAKRS